MKKFNPWITIKDGRLYNKNSERFEGCPGDRVKVPVYNMGKMEIKEATLWNFTDHQIIPTKEFGILVIPANDMKYVEFID